MAITELTLGEALQGSLNQTDQIQAQAKDLSAFAQANTVSSNAFTGMYATVASYVEFITTAKAVVGIQQYARDQLGDQTKDYDAWTQAMVTAASDYNTFFFGFYPTASGAAGDWMQERKLTTTGIDTRQLTPAESVNIIPFLDALAAVPPFRT